MACPSGKIVFTTRLSAWQAAIQKGNKYNHKLAPYTCPFCGKFHLTKRESTVKGSTIPHRVGARLNLETGTIYKKSVNKHKKSKLFKMPNYNKPRFVDTIPPWKKRILKFIIKILRIK